MVGVDLDPGAEGELTIQADVSDEAQVAEMYEKAKAEFGRIDVLFNNAGINPTDDGSVLDTSLEAWQRSRTSTCAASSSAASTASPTCSRRAAAR